MGRWGASCGTGAGLLAGGLQAGAGLLAGGLQAGVLGVGLDLI